MSAKEATPEEPTVERLSLQLRVQHGLLMVTATLLILTGLALLYRESWFGQLLMALEGGYETRGIIHRVAAVLLMITTVYHLGYLFLTREGHEEFLQILPRARGALPDGVGSEGDPGPESGSGGGEV